MTRSRQRKDNHSRSSLYGVLLRTGGYCWGFVGLCILAYLAECRAYYMVVVTSVAEYTGLWLVGLLLRVNWPHRGQMIQEHLPLVLRSLNSLNLNASLLSCLEPFLK